MSGNTWWTAKIGAKLLSDLAIFLIFSSSITLDFRGSICVMPLKYLIFN